MTDIYEQHEKAFAGVSAFVILHNGERVATIAFRHPNRGMRLWVYMHWLGIEMVRGHADGGGYDKHSAAVDAAARKLKSLDAAGDVATGEFFAFLAACHDSDGRRWDNRLRDAGFTVLQAV